MSAEYQWLKERQEERLWKFQPFENSPNQKGGKSTKRSPRSKISRKSRSLFTLNSLKKAKSESALLFRDVVTVTHIKTNHLNMAEELTRSP